MATKFTITILSSFLYFHASAFNIVPFWQDDFSLGLLPANWSTDDACDGDELWQHCEDFNECPPISFYNTGIYPNFRFKSASMENGFAYLAPFQSTGSHCSSLSTGAIDCSTNAQVFLTFNTFIIAHSSEIDNAAVVEVREGPFGTWVPFKVFPNINASTIEPDPIASSFGDELITSFNGQNITIDITTVAAGHDEIYIRWRWEWTGQSEYFWLIDDVNLLNQNPLDENAIWGMGSNEGNFNGGLNDWTAPPILGCSWEWTENGMVDSKNELDDLADLYSCSYSAENGAAAMNALCSPGQPSFVLAELISPVIDLSAALPDKKLGIRFSQTGVAGNVANNNLPLNSIMVSIDGGFNFFDTIFLNLAEPFAKPFCNTKIVPLPLEVIGSNQFVFKFIFSGNSFFWIIDDVRVIELFENDLRISEDYFAVAPNYNSPVDLIEPIGFRAEVQNIGNDAQDFTNLFVEVQRDDTHEPVFKDTLFLGTIEAGEVSEDIPFNKKFLPEPNLSYTGYYTVSSDKTDEHQLDNRTSFQFETQGRTLSKQKDRFAINSGFAPLSNNVRYEIGTCFFIPPGEGADAVSVNFALVNAEDIANSTIPVNVGVNLYKWKNGTNFGDANDDFYANEDEFEQVAQTFHPIDDETLRMRDVITVPLMEPVTMEDSTYYFATIDYYSAAVMNLQQIPFGISASEEINYNAMFAQSESCEQPRYVSMLRLFDQTDFQVNAWGLMRIPFIQLNTDMATPIIDKEPDQIPFTLFPNPTNGQFNIYLPDVIAKGKIAYEIYDICGRLAMTRQNVEAFVSQLPIDASQLGNGIYNLRVISGERVGNKRFVIGNAK